MGPQQRLPCFSILRPVKSLSVFNSVFLIELIKSRQIGNLRVRAAWCAGSRGSFACLPPKPAAPCCIGTAPGVHASPQVHTACPVCRRWAAAWWRCIQTAARLQRCMLLVAGCLAACSFEESVQPPCRGQEVLQTVSAWAGACMRSSRRGETALCWAARWRPAWVRRCTCWPRRPSTWLQAVRASCRLLWAHVPPLACVPQLVWHRQWITGQGGARVPHSRQCTIMYKTVATP